MTWSPTETESSPRLPLSSSLPGPTARTLPRCGFSLAVSGRTMPPAVRSSASTGSTTTRSSRGRILIFGISESFCVVLCVRVQNYEFRILNSEFALHHSFHATHATHSSAHSVVVVVVAAFVFLLFGNLGDEGFGGEQEGGNAGV